MRFVKNNYDLVLSIVDSLDDEQRGEICNGSFGDSPYVIYREVMVDNGIGVAFIDLYQTEDMNDVAVVIARRNGSEYDHKGYASKLVERAILEASLRGWNLIWPVRDYNTRSIRLAETYNIPMDIHHKEGS